MFLICIGSYERLLFGLKYDGTNEISPMFIYPSHISSIRAIASAGKFLVSGATDEIIKIYDIKLRKEVGTIMQHSGSITQLEFYHKSHLVSASEDMELCLYRTRDWEVLKSFKGHKGAITSFSIHPSGKLLLSAGRDKTIRCWDLMRGLCAKTIKVPQTVDKIQWNSDGSKYLTVSEKTLKVADIDSGSAICEWNASLRINSATFVQTKDGNELILAGGEEKMLFVFDVANNVLASSVNLSLETRVKDIKCIANKEKTFVVLCSSDGIVKVLDLEAIPMQGEEQQMECLAEYNAGTRLTCLELMDIESLGIFEDNAEEQEVAVVESEAESEAELEIKKSAPKVTVQFEGEKKSADSKHRKKRFKKK